MIHGVCHRLSVRSRMRVAAFGFLIGIVGCAGSPAARGGPPPAGEAPWLWGGLAPGPHAVGLETITVFDSARREPSAAGTVGLRPLELVVWTPARPHLTRSPLTFARYVDLSMGAMVGTGAGASLDARRRWLAASMARTPDSVDASVVERVLDAPMFAVEGATPIAERSPLVLWSTRHATPAAQSVLSELLASHGYVVAWTRYAGRDSLSPPYDGVSPQRKVEVLEAHVADMQFALRALAAHPAVDSTRMAVAAWSYGGEPATLLAQRTPRLRALVSLSSSAFTWPYRPSVNVAASLDSVPLRLDVLMLEESGATRGRLREPPRYFDRLPGKVFRVTFPTLAHGNFNVLEGLLPELVGITAVQPWSEGSPAARGGYQTIARSVLTLLDKVLQGAPGDGSLAGARYVRQPSGRATPVTFSRHGPGRGVSATAATSFVDDTVVIASDGWRLIGNMVRPATGARTAAVLLLNKANGDRRVYARLARELARRGVSSLRLDLRGHGESTNLATFVPGLANAASEGEERDVAAALRWLRAHQLVDSTRIGVVGASYSGEAMAVAARAGDGARAYVALSPGSLSEETIAGIDLGTVPWLIAVSKNERFLRGVVAAVRERSRSASITELDGAAHASDILVTHPDLATGIADWLAARLK